MKISQTAMMTHQLWSSLGYADLPDTSLLFTGEGQLPSAFPVSQLAGASIATAGLAVAALIKAKHGLNPQVTVDQRLASLWFAWSLKPINWQLPSAWDAIAGDYQASDGWIRLHTNAPHHRSVVERLLGPHKHKAAVADAVSRWKVSELEHAVITSGGCAAQMHSHQHWQQHMQGKSVARESIFAAFDHPQVTAPTWEIPLTQPLAGMRVLDLTRVLAGPTATRFLAGLGADVLRIDPFSWDEPAIEPEVTLGKRCARLNLTNHHDRLIFEALLRQADIIIHGYRAGALEGLGYGAQQRRQLSPGLVDICLNAYGWSGPWRSRRGFDSLVQMSCGIAEAGMIWQNTPHPFPLPVQALDHATGYLMAAAAIQGLIQRLIQNTGYSARLSLARTANILIDTPYKPDNINLKTSSATTEDYQLQPEMTYWGPALRLRAPLSLSTTQWSWGLAASPLGNATAHWLQ